METLKFKVGDKVRVKSLKWYNENKNLDGDIIDKEGKKNGVFTKYMRCWCGDVIIIYSVKNNYYGANNGWSWYDWMLEDEPVQEVEQLNQSDMETKEMTLREAQEVEQLNQSDMETKEMTLREAQEFLNNKKIMCLSEEETTKVQTKLLELGFMWRYNGKAILPNNLLIGVNDKILESLCFNEWVESANAHLPNDELLAIQIKEEKPKFNPNTLQPFDKVLVRQGKHSEWLARFFDFCEDDNYYTTSGSAWVMCVPYNEETKHLHGTIDEAPEFYRI